MANKILAGRRFQARFGFCKGKPWQEIPLLERGEAADLRSQQMVEHRFDGSRGGASLVDQVL